MARYTHGHHESVLRSHRWRTVANSAQYLRPYLVPGASVLDVGCGPGTITANFGELVGENGNVLGIDVADDVIAIARREPHCRNVEFNVTDLYDDALPERAFDVVHAHQVLQHLDEPVAALRRMSELAKPGGVVAARDVDFGASRLPGIRRPHRLAVPVRQLARTTAANQTRDVDSPWANQAEFDDVSLRERLVFRDSRGT